MEAIGLLVTPEARAGKQTDAEAFLKSAQNLTVRSRSSFTNVSSADAVVAKPTSLWTANNTRSVL
jgi:hypothetical protein